MSNLKNRAVDRSWRSWSNWLELALWGAMLLLERFPILALSTILPFALLLWWVAFWRNATIVPPALHRGAAHRDAQDEIFA
jgi:hypothetical protein